MSGTPSTVRVICLNPEVAKSLRGAAIGVFPQGESPPWPPAYDLAPAVYLHAPPLIVPEVYPLGQWPGAASDAALRGLFHKALKEAGAQGPPLLAPLESLLPDLKRSLAAGHVLGLVFAEKVAVDDRYALLPWGAWRHAHRPGLLPRARQWCDTWKVPPEQLTLAPSLEYTPDLLKDLLPVLPPPTSWAIPVTGQTPSAESLRRQRIALRQSDLSGVRPPGFHFKVRDAPMEALAVKDGPGWGAALLPTEGLRVRVIVQARNCDSVPKETVEQAVAKSYRVDPSAVRVVPLFVNRLGDWLGVAVRIGKGAILILPEFPDRAAVVKRLVTEWERIQAWLAAFSAPPAQLLPQSQSKALPKGEQASDSPSAALGQPADTPLALRIRVADLFEQAMQKVDRIMSQPPAGAGPGRRALLRSLLEQKETEDLLLLLARMGPTDNPMRNAQIALAEAKEAADRKAQERAEIIVELLKAQRERTAPGKTHGSADTMPKPRSRAAQAQELIEAIDALVSWVKEHQDQVLDYFGVVKPQLHPLGARVEMLAEALGLASPEDPAYLAGEPEITLVGLAPGHPLLYGMMDHKTWPGWAERHDDGPWRYKFLRITMCGCPWFDWMEVLRRKAEMILPKEANGQAPVPPHAAGPVAPAIDKGRAGEDRRKRRRGGKKANRPPKVKRAREKRKRTVERQENRRTGHTKLGTEAASLAQQPPQSAAPSPIWSKPCSKVEAAAKLGISVENLNDHLKTHPQAVQKVTRQKWQFDTNLPLFSRLPRL